MSNVRTPLESRILLRLASFLVPREQRADWRREWDGEVWWWISSQPDEARSLRERLALAAHCAGSISDGLHLRVEQNGAQITALRALLRRPGTCLAIGACLIAAVGVFSGGFGNTRHIAGEAWRGGNPRLAIVSQVGPFVALRQGVPLRRVEYWDAHSPALDGIAPFAWHQATTSVAAPGVRAATVGPRFFSLLDQKAALGRVFSSGDEQACQNCIVIGYDFWKGPLKSDSNIVGRVIAVDGHASRVIGVLPKDFHFLDERPAVWSMFVSGAAPVKTAGAIALLNPGASADSARAELERMGRYVTHRTPGTWIAVDPLNSIMSRPGKGFGLVFVIFAALALALSLGRLAFHSSVPAETFLFLKSIMLLTLVFLATIEFTGAGRITANGGSATYAGLAYYWLIVAGSLALLWSWADQRKRCHRCLNRLELPVRIGEAGMLLSPSGTELVCTRGHGLLFTVEGDLVTPQDRWYPLDATWSELFSTTPPEARGVR